MKGHGEIGGVRTEMMKRERTNVKLIQILERCVTPVRQIHVHLLSRGQAFEWRRGETDVSGLVSVSSEADNITIRNRMKGFPAKHDGTGLAHNKILSEKRFEEQAKTVRQCSLREQQKQKTLKS